MFNKKMTLVTVVAALVMALGLSACASNSSSSGSASSAASSAASESSSASSAAASSDATSAAALTSDYWAGTLADGSTVDYFDDVESMKPGLVILNADGTEGKSWVGEITASSDGKTMTITDEATKEVVTIVPNPDPAAGTMQWEIEGYGEVTLEKTDTGAYQEHLAQVSELA